MPSNDIFHQLIHMKTHTRTYDRRKHGSIAFARSTRRIKKQNLFAGRNPEIPPVCTGMVLLRAANCKPQCYQGIYMYTWSHRSAGIANTNARAKRSDCVLVVTTIHTTRTAVNQNPQISVSTVNMHRPVVGKLAHASRQTSCCGHENHCR